MPVRRDRSESLPDQGFPHTATVTAGSLLFTAGIAAIDADGNVAPEGDVVGQTKACLANLERVLDERGAGLPDVAKLTVHVAERLAVDLAVAWDAVVEAFGGDVPPASVVGVTVLPLDNQLVEIEAVASLEE
ncbi:hypothetical protein GOARA_082_00390 [Gordonia araii NBRC 100433]|uniref:YjgF/YER057c/UK114 family protein n=1 Tax=Gordonia araii NBRC 100433 TaxID=1073574 RepID=G7H726_9ACTN|nr:RidA family protein [Gordonia araii]NNG97647.1 RidA family protein [Gordonia araii NBRC 100433]GAB11651.1 hypothetical protein GOARA_082_00390 [Gordonia araii NBRC 100433]